MSDDMIKELYVILHPIFDEHKTGITMIITIARQCGCDAESVGRLLADFYGVPLYTRKDFLDKARSMGQYDEMYDFFSEHPIDDFAMAVTMQESVTKEVRERLRKAVNCFVGNEDCIIVGRCGNIILDNRKDLTSVFLHAPHAVRVDRIASRHQLSREDAAERVDRIDEERRSYHSYYTGHTWGDAAEYDLSINVHRFGADATARIIEQALDAK